MSGHNLSEQLTQNISGITSVSLEHIQGLQAILESQYKRPVEINEAQKYGQTLVDVFSILAGGREILGIAGTTKAEHD